MTDLSKFLWQRSRGQFLLIHALHSDYDTYCKFARRAKISVYEAMKYLEILDIKVIDVVKFNSPFDREVKEKILRHIFCHMKENKQQIIKEVTHDNTKNTKD